VEIQFNHLLPLLAGTAFTAEVVEVDNAREAVRHGVIRGIRARTRRNCITSGMIHVPTFNPYTDAALIVAAHHGASRTKLPAAGTDLHLRLILPLHVGDQPELPSFRLLWMNMNAATWKCFCKVNQTAPPPEAVKIRRRLTCFRRFSKIRSDAFTAAGWRTADANSKTLSSSSSRPFDTFKLSQHACLAPLLSASCRTWLGRRVSIVMVSVDIFVCGPNQNDSGEQAWLSAYTREGWRGSFRIITSSSTTSTATSMTASTCLCATLR
jgi:hypothetical protein